MWELNMDVTFPPRTDCKKGDFYDMSEYSKMLDALGIFFGVFPCYCTCLIRNTLSSESIGPLGRRGGLGRQGADETNGGLCDPLPVLARNTN